MMELFNGAIFNCEYLGIIHKDKHTQRQLKCSLRMQTNGTQNSLGEDKQQGFK